MRIQRSAVQRVHERNAIFAHDVILIGAVNGAGAERLDDLEGGVRALDAAQRLVPAALGKAQRRRRGGFDGEEQIAFERASVLAVVHPQDVRERVSGGLAAPLQLRFQARRQPAAEKDCRQRAALVRAAVRDLGVQSVENVRLRVHHPDRRALGVLANRRFGRRLAGYYQRHARLIDEKMIRLVRYGDVESGRDALGERPRDAVAQIVEADFARRGEHDFARVLMPALVGVHVGDD